MICHWVAVKSHELDIRIFFDKEMLKDYAHIGDGEIPDEVKALIQPQEWTSGWLYSNSKNQKILSDAESLFAPRNLNEFFFPQGINLNLNDCIVHAVNFCLRTPWFVSREQAFRLIKKNNHRTDSHIAATK